MVIIHLIFILPSAEEAANSPEKEEHHLRRRRQQEEAQEEEEAEAGGKILVDGNGTAQEKGDIKKETKSDRAKKKGKRDIKQPSEKKTEKDSEEWEDRTSHPTEDAGESTNRTCIAVIGHRPSPSIGRRFGPFNLITIPGRSEVNPQTRADRGYCFFASYPYLAQTSFHSPAAIQSIIGQPSRPLLVDSCATRLFSRRPFRPGTSSLPHSLVCFSRVLCRRLVHRAHVPPPHISSSTSPCAPRPSEKKYRWSKTVGTVQFASRPDSGGP